MISLNNHLVKGLWAGFIGTIFGDDLIHWSAITFSTPQQPVTT